MFTCEWYQKVPASGATKSYVNEPRERWVLGPPGQVVLAVSQVMWTKETTDALASGGRVTMPVTTRGRDRQARKRFKALWAGF